MLIVDGEYRGLDTSYKSVHLPQEIWTWQVFQPMHEVRELEGLECEVGKGC